MLDDESKMQQNEQRPALRSKKSLTQLLGLGRIQQWPSSSSFPAMPARATEIIQAHQNRDLDLSQAASKNSCSVANNNSTLNVLDDAFRTPTKSQQQERNFSFDSDTYSDYFVPTPTPKPKARKAPKALRAVKSMDTFRSNYTSLSIMTSERSPSPTDGYMSMQELLSSRGFTDTRIITPETFKARAAQAKRPAAQTVFSKSADQVPTLNTSDSLHPLRPKVSLVGMLGSLWTSGTPPLESPPIEHIPASPTSISSRASDSSEEEEVLQTSPVEPEAQQDRINTWVRSTELPTRPISPVSTKSDRSIRSARSFASLSVPAAPALCLESDPRDDKTPTATTFARPNEDLRKRLRHAVSVPIFADPPVTEAVPPVPSLPVEQKSLRKTTSAAMMRSKPLQPVLSTATPASTRVVKLPSPDRQPSIEPKGVRSDVRGLFGESASPCKQKVTKAQGDKRASSSLKTLLGRSEKTLPFSVGMKMPAGVQRLGKGVKSWDVEDVENRPLRRVDRI